MAIRVGVVSIQGDFDKHIRALRQTGIEGLEVIEVRTPEALGGVDRIILPGGESTTVGMLMDRHGLGAALKAAAAEGVPIWGTCMGMILMANQVSGSAQYRLGILDVEVVRNAFGAQINSFEDEVSLSILDEPLTGVFIRAPVVSKVGPGVEILGTYRDKIVAVRQGNLIGTSFHPELTEDTSLHKWFLTN